jgi:hypothetical protein
MGDSYILTPTFYTGRGKVLVLVEIGAEYSWGLRAYEFRDGTLVDLGPLDAALWSGENHVNPLERARVSFGSAGYRVEFPYDLTLDPGGLHQWNLPRLNDTISFTQYCLDLYELLQRDPLFVVKSAHRYFEGDFPTLLGIWINESFDVVIEDLIEATRPVHDDPLVKEFLDEARRMNKELWASAEGG